MNLLNRSYRACQVGGTRWGCFPRGAFAILVSLLLTAGCIPEKRIIWNADGSAGAVFSEQGLYLIDGGGAVLTAPFSDQPVRGAWFADGRRLAVVHRQPVRTWRDVQSLLSKEDIERVRTISEDSMRRIMGTTGDLNDFEFDPGDRLSGGLEAAALVYLREQHPAELARRLGDDWPAIQTAEPSVQHLSIVEHRGGELAIVRTLRTTMDSMQLPAPSPDGQFIAYLAPAGTDGGADDRSLWIIPTAGGEPRFVCRNVSRAFDWSANGLSLAFIRANAATSRERDSLQLGSLSTVQVRNSDGTLMSDFPQPEDKAGLIYNDDLSLAWMKDDRILFSSAEFSLPATQADMPQRWGLFAFDPRMPATIIRVTGRGFSAPIDLAVPLFDLSPDESRVVLPAAKGCVVLYNILTAESTILNDAADGELHALPTWRGNDEICYVQPIEKGASNQTPRVMLWRDGQSRSISDSWPASMIAGWLIEPTNPDDNSEAEH